MNKKLFLGMFAAAGMLFATSCSNDELDMVQSGNEAQVTFNLGTEGGIATRAISDGKSADILYYAIYNADKQLITTINGSTNGLLKKEEAFPDGSKQDVVEVTLAKGQEYTAVFWAQNASCDAYTVTAETDGLKVAIDYDGDNNDETRDAFFKAETFTVTGNTKIPVVLKRPFAQINVGVTEADWNAAVESGIEITESKVVIKNAANSINLLDGTVSGEEEVTYDFAKIPTDPATLEVDVDRDGTIQDTEKYKYLSMSYILTDNDADRTTLEADGLQFTFSPATGEDIVFDEGLHAVPVLRNWRTNILGKLLTGDIQFNIVIDERFDDDYNYPEFEEVNDGVKYDATTKTYYLYSAAGLQWVSEQSNTHSNTFKGYTVKLTSDVDMSNVNWTPIGNSSKHFQGIFDGQNHVISNLTTTAPENADDNYAAGLFGWVHYGGTVKNVKMTDVNVNSIHYAGAVVGYIYGTVENCHVDGGTVTSTVKNNDNGNHVGGIAGYVAKENLESGSAVKNCSVNGLTVTAYRDVAGIVGTANTGVVVENNRVSNTVVIADQLCEYNEEKSANAAEIVGRNIANADLTSNTTNNVTVKVYTIENGVASVSNNTQLAYVLSVADVHTIYLSEGEFKANLYSKDTAPERESLTIIGTDGTTFAHTAVQHGQLNLSLFKNFTIRNCEIKKREVGNKDWGMVVFGSSNNAEGIYTIEDCTFNGVGTQGIYINENNSGATYNILNCTFNGDFGTEGAITIQANKDVNHIINVKSCTFNNIPNTSHKIIVVPYAHNPEKYYYGFTLNTDMKASTAADIVEFVKWGFTTIELEDGEYDVYGCAGKTLTIKGSKNAVLKVSSGDNVGNNFAFGNGQGGGTGIITFEGITINTTDNNGPYKGYAYIKPTFIDCAFVGEYSCNAYTEHKFTDCTFDTRNGYFWVWAATKLSFDNCKFGTNSKAILAHGYQSTEITINNCKFEAKEKGYTSSGDNTACVEIDPVETNTYTIKFTGTNTKTDYYNGWTRVKDGSTGHKITGVE